ncbi:SH3 domain-containing protein [Latilactobacillus curvatus]
MTKNNLIKLVVAFGAAILVASNLTSGVQAYSVDNTYKLADNEGSAYKTSNNYIILHDVGTESKAWENASYLKRAWLSTQSYVQYYVGDGGKVYSGGAEGYQAWGAGAVANAASPVQIELAHTYDKTQFAKDYAAYVNLARNSAIKYGIPLTLDGNGRGIKTHLWVTNNIWGNHTDPYDYLARFGVTKQKLSHDLQTGLPEDGTATVPSKPTPTTPSNQNERAENWHFTNGDQPIQARLGQPSLSAPYAGKLPAWTTIYYDRVAVRDGYVWCHWTTNNGDSVWMPVHPVGTANNVWVSFD